MRVIRVIATVVWSVGLTVALCSVSWAAPCQLTDNGGGTVDLPPPGCDYVGETVWQIVDGLPPGTTIDIDVTFSNYSGSSAAPGGSLGGEAETFNLVIELQMTGTGSLAGFARSIAVPAAAVTHSGPRTPGDAIQSFATDWFSLQGTVFGDPDFDQLQIRAGVLFALPSPGQTTLTRLGPPGSDFNVDSFFDVEYRIDFIGAPGGLLAGLSGTTISGVTAGVDSVVMRTGESVTAASGDHYHCYKAKDLRNPKFVSVPGVTLDDQFGSHFVEVKKPFLVCPPASKNGSGIDDPVNHLCCYKIKGPKLDPAISVETTDQFGSLQQQLKKSSILCQPCLKTVLP